MDLRRKRKTGRPRRGGGKRLLDSLDRGVGLRLGDLRDDLVVHVE